MAALPLCSNCVTGSIHSGTPTGKEDLVHGLQTYIAIPGDDVVPKAIVVMIPDAFGWKMVNNRLLCDTYAKKGGYLVYLPDFMNGMSFVLLYFDMVFPCLFFCSVVTLLRRGNDTDIEYRSCTPSRFLEIRRATQCQPSVVSFKVASISQDGICSTSTTDASPPKPLSPKDNFLFKSSSDNSTTTQHERRLEDRCGGLLLGRGSRHSTRMG